jgi:acyl carrier protein
MPVHGKKDTTVRPVEAAEPRESVARLVGEVGNASPTDETLLGLDSLGLVELVVRLEEHFRVDIPDWILDDDVFSSIDNLATMLVQVGVGALGDGGTDGSRTQEH